MLTWQFKVLTIFSPSFACKFEFKRLTNLQNISKDGIFRTFFLEPERALEIYEQAIKKNPRDSQLAAKMGQVND